MKISPTMMKFYEQLDKVCGFVINTIAGRRKLIEEQ